MVVQFSVHRQCARKSSSNVAIGSNPQAPLGLFMPDARPFIRQTSKFPFFKWAAICSSVGRDPFAARFNAGASALTWRPIFKDTESAYCQTKCKYKILLVAKKNAKYSLVECYCKSSCHQDQSTDSGPNHYSIPLSIRQGGPGLLPVLMQRPFLHRSVFYFA